MGFVIITGCPRSGTSMVTALLQKCGLFLGNNLRDGNHHNPKGFFEDKDFTYWNKIIFRQISELAGERYEWYNPPPQEMVTCWPAFGGTMQRFLAQWPTDRLCGFKEIRTCITLPIWVRGIGADNLKVVLVRRDFDEIAKSMEISNNIKQKNGLTLAHQLINTAHDNLEGINFIETEHRAYFTDWHGELSRVCDFLGLYPPSAEAEKEIEDFIDSGLWHHRKGKNIGTL